MSFQWGLVIIAAKHERMRAPIVKNSPRFATYLALRLAAVAMLTAAVLALGLLAAVLLPLIRGLDQAQFQAYQFYLLNLDGSVLSEEERVLAYDPRERQWFCTANAGS